MKNQFDMIALGFAVILSCLLSACTATPIKPGGFQGEYDKPLDVVKQASIDAITVHGFEVTQNNPTYIEGHRPRTWGFFCTPGGEGVGIWLEQTSQSHTRAWINSEKSSFGMACQKEWVGPILAEMEKSLGQRK
jgi:hypothetical protein